MSDNISAGNSLIFYTGKNYAGTAQSVSHGVTGVLAASTTSWSEQSVAMSGMQAFVSSAVNPGDASVVYLGHQEDLVTVSQTDLTLLYPSSDQFPLNYLGLDPAQAVMVWLDVDAAQAAPNAVASTALVGASPTTLTTLSLPGRPGLLGCVAKIGGSSVVASCAYGDYNTADGTVAWSGAGMLILEYTGGGISLIDGGGFPDGWTFSDPQLQGDGSWVVTLNGGVPASDTISTVTATPGSITDDGVSASVITAKVVDGTGQPAGGVTVTWSTTLGNLSATSSVTGADGTATTTLTDSGTPGTATVTAAITGSSKTVDVTVTDSAAGYVLTGLTSDKDIIDNDGVDTATLTATVHDGSGNPVAGVTVYWSTTAGNLSAASSVTGSSGQATINLTDSGTPGTATVTASLANGSTLTRTITVVPGTLNLYPQANYQGTAVELSEHVSKTLRNGANYWEYDSAKMGGDRLLSYTVYAPESTGYDYRTYRDDYSAADVPDISQAYGGASPEISGLALGENDVVVRVHLVPDDTTQSVVLSAAQHWPQAFNTASVNGKGVVQDGVLVVFDKTLSVTVPLQLGSLNEDGTADWQVETSVTAVWNESLQQPVLTLDSSAPADWTLGSLQATGQVGEYTAVLSGILPSSGLSIYYITDSASSIADYSGGAVNAVAIYGDPGTLLVLKVDQEAVFYLSGKKEINVILDETGYTYQEIYCSYSETIKVSIISANETTEGYVRFIHEIESVSTNAPADGKTPVTAHMGYGGYTNSTKGTVSIDGNSRFEDGTQTYIIPLPIPGMAWAYNVKIYNDVAEVVNVRTLITGGPSDIDFTLQTTFVPFDR